MKSFLSSHDFENLVHAFITTRLAYCKTFYTGISQASIAGFQLVQNETAWLLTCRQEHFFPIPPSLHWHPVPHRFLFKTVLFAHTDASVALLPPNSLSYMSTTLLHGPWDQAIRCSWGSRTQAVKWVAAAHQKHLPFFKRTYFHWDLMPYESQLSVFYVY